MGEKGVQVELECLCIRGREKHGLGFSIQCRVLFRAENELLPLLIVRDAQLDTFRASPALPPE